LLGVGIGLIIGVLFMISYNYTSSITDAQIEEKARGLGMHMEGECKVFFKEDVNND